MLTNCIDSIFKHSFYWLLPVVVFNFFTAGGIQEHLLELPSLAQAEQLAETRVEDGEVYMPSAIALVTAMLIVRALPDLRRLDFSEVEKSVSNNFSALFATNNLLRFYGKAAPEALDKWVIHQQA
jgi:hypothetical protein